MDRAHRSPLQLILSPCQIADIERTTVLIADFRTDAVIADKSFDADALVLHIQASGAQVVIPPRSNQIENSDVYTHGGLRLTE